MTNISSIKSYMYCPRKQYIQENILQMKTEIHPIYGELKILRNDINSILNKNMRKLKKEMDLDEIEKTLTRKIPKNIENTFDEITSDSNISNEKIDEIYEDTNNQIYYNIKMLSLKAKRAMELLKKDGIAISDMFFPSSMCSYYMKDNKLDLIGICDKIEIIDGAYYPIIFKNNSPPMKGVWKQDAIELSAHSLLVEREFDCDVFVGFVEYQKIDERRPVIMDVNLRKAIFNILHEINQLKLLKKAPKVKVNENKCKICECRNICLEEKV